MGSQLHEIRDPIHVFVRLDSDERKVINSAPYQRLREIHQLAMTYLVYPGATHKRFEHCLGVMELASRIYDVVTDQSNLHGGTVRALVSSQSGHKLAIGVRYFGWQPSAMISATFLFLMPLKTNYYPKAGIMSDLA